MTVFRRRPNKKNWFRFALKLGLLATDAKVLSSFARMLTERDDSSESLRRRATVSADIEPHRGWSHASTLFIGFAIGVGVGMLYAPVSGEEARNAIREKMTDMRGKVSDVATWAGRGGPETASPRSTGTYAE